MVPAWGRTLILRPDSGRVPAGVSGHTLARTRVHGSTRGAVNRGRHSPGEAIPPPASWPALPCWPSASGSARSRQVPCRRTSPAAPPTPSRPAAHRPDNRPGPLTKQQDRLRTKALAMLESGDAKLQKRSGGGATVTLKGGPQGVDAVDSFEFPVNRTDQIWTVLSEFGGTGPAHNEIAAAQPDRRKPDQRQLDVLGRRLQQGPLRGPVQRLRRVVQATTTRSCPAAGTTVGSTVEDWVQVPGDAADYGANARRGRRRHLGSSSRTPATPGTPSSSRPARTTAADRRLPGDSSTQWDRYDFDNDGNFNEADGYIDHFQAVHAGEGEEAGGGAQGADAIWSHRWYVNDRLRHDRPERRRHAEQARRRARSATPSFWIGDYTVEPENGGLGVFAHEYGHDLGLPDYYDTAGGENGTAFWTLMSSGSWLGHGAADRGHRHHARPDGSARRSSTSAGSTTPTVDAGQTAHRRTWARRRTPTTTRRPRPTRPTRRSRSTCRTRRRPTTYTTPPRAPTPGGRAAATTSTTG